MCAVCRPDGAPVEAADIAAMLAALDHWDADSRGMWTGSGIGLGHLQLSTTPESTLEALPLPDSERGLAITGDFRLDNRSELALRLGIDAGDLATLSDGGLVLRAYAAWGESCAARLLGDFAFVVWDGPKRQLYCARDVFGVKPFHYTHGRGVFACASEIKGLLALPFVDRCVNERWIGDYLHRLALDRVDTFYRDVSRLEPAHALLATADGVRTWRYWRLDEQPPVHFARDEDYVEAFREKLVLAVRRRVRTPGAVGAELSGGLDSSGVCAIAHALLRGDGRELRTFSQVRPDGDGDYGEMPADGRAAIDALCSHAGMPRPCLLTGEGGILPAIQWASRCCDEPPRNLVSLFNDALYDAAAASGVRVLLSGFGGNQGVTDLGVGRLRELLYQGPWSELAREVSSWPHPVLGGARMLASELRRDDGWGRRWFGGPSVVRQKHPHRASRTEFAERLGLLQRTRDATRMQRAAALAPLRERTIRLLDAPDVPLRLESAHLATAARRIEYRYPLLDAELVGVYLWAPARLKWQRGIGRYLFRMALEPWLPPEICWANAGRTSANPGNPRRKRRDLPEMLAQLQGLPKDSPLFDYADPGKLSVEEVRLGRRVKRWRRDTETIMLLLLERKLREARPVRG